MRIITGILCFLLPSRILWVFLRPLGHKVSSRCRIGFSFLATRKLCIASGVRIGHFNFIQIDDLECASDAKIGNFNSARGPLKILLHEKAAIGNNNRMYRGPAGVTYGDATLDIGLNSKVTGGHRIDCTRSVKIGEHSILAGHESQIWTHGYYHDVSGPGRFRLDGEVSIGNNVYLGSRCVINPCVTIANAVSVGAGSVVSKSLTEPGVYVGQGLRYLGPPVDRRGDFKRIQAGGLVEEVYVRKPGH